MRAARLHHRLLEMKRLQKCQSSSWKACCYGGSLTNNYNASRNTPITIEHLQPVSRSLHSMATLASHTSNPPVFRTGRLFSSSTDDMAQKSFEEWNKTLQSYAKNSELQKIDASIDFINDNFQNEELSATTIASIFDAYTKAQQDLLNQLDHNGTEHSATNKSDDSNTDNIDSNIDIESKNKLAILNKAFEITNDVDDLLQEYGAHKNNHLQAKHYDIVIQAWDELMAAYDKAHVTKKGFPQRATYHLELMERMALNHNNKGAAPTIDTYNRVLDMWSRSQEHLLSSRAESIMKRIGFSHLSHSNSHPNDGTVIAEALGVEPNADTYRIMMRAWCKTSSNVALSKPKIGNAAFNATGYLMKMQSMMEKGDGDFEPTLEDYTVVFRAWARAGYAKYAGKRALSLLKKMESLAAGDSAVTTVRPDVTCYKYVLQAFSESKAQYLEGLGYQGEAILSRMEDNGLVPDSDCFTYAIQTWSNSACRNELTEEDVDDYALKAHQLLDKKTQMHFRSGIVAVKTSTLDYNNVMRAWSRSSSADGIKSVETLLSTIERLYAEGDTQMKPNYESYNHAINSLGNDAKIGDQIDHILDLLTRMNAQYKDGNIDCKPNIQCYNAVINVCGNGKFKTASEEEKRNALKCTIKIIQELKDSRKVASNSRTYSLALEAFSVLMDKRSAEFAKVVDSLFGRCCNEGLVDDKVIKAFHRVAPYSLYRRSVLAAASPDKEIDGTTISETLFLPEEWTRNINGIRQRIPLAVDGRFVHARSQSVSEHKMRRLRKKTNKILLQGGRS